MLDFKGAHGVIILENVILHTTYLRTVSQKIFSYLSERESERGMENGIMKSFVAS
jgi:hypothetical protein